MGGRSRNPILMMSHVELQTTQSVSHASGTPHPGLTCHLSFGDALFVFICAPTIARSLQFVKPPYAQCFGALPKQSGPQRKDLSRRNAFAGMPNARTNLLETVMTVATRHIR